jgi:hypothetical protein
MKTSFALYFSFSYDNIEYIIPSIHTADQSNNQKQNANQYPRKKNTQKKTTEKSRRETGRLYRQYHFNGEGPQFDIPQALIRELEVFSHLFKFFHGLIKLDRKLTVLLGVRLHELL